MSIASLFASFIAFFGTEIIRSALSHRISKWLNLPNRLLLALRLLQNVCLDLTKWIECPCLLCQDVLKRTSEGDSSSLREGFYAWLLSFARIPSYSPWSLWPDATWPYASLQFQRVHTSSQCCHFHWMKQNRLSWLLDSAAVGASCCRPCRKLRTTSLWSAAANWEAWRCRDFSEVYWCPFPFCCFHAWYPFLCMVLRTCWRRSGMSSPLWYSQDYAC